MTSDDSWQFLLASVPPVMMMVVTGGFCPGGPLRPRLLHINSGQCSARHRAIHSARTVQDTVQGSRVDCPRVADGRCSLHRSAHHMLSIPCLWLDAIICPRKCFSTYMMYDFHICIGSATQHKSIKQTTWGKMSLDAKDSQTCNTKHQLQMLKHVFRKSRPRNAGWSDPAG